MTYHTCSLQKFSSLKNNKNFNLGFMWSGYTGPTNVVKIYKIHFITLSEDNQHQISLEYVE